MTIYKVTYTRFNGEFKHHIVSKYKNAIEINDRYDTDTMPVYKNDMDQIMFKSISEGKFIKVMVYVLCLDYQLDNAIALLKKHAGYGQ